MAHKGHAFSVKIYCRSVEIDLFRALPAVLRANLSLLGAKSVAPYKHTKLLRTKIELLRGKFDASPPKSNASPLKIRCFSAQIECFSVENSIFLRTNQKLLRGKFDVSQYKSKVFPCKIRCFSVQIESDRKLLHGKLHSELGDLGSPPGQQIAGNYVSGEGSCVVCKDILSIASKWSRPAFIKAGERGGGQEGQNTGAPNCLGGSKSW